jgi:5-(carboxyamino)imidazole ribonucleotide mutase
MPGGIPVATVALNGAKNAGILAASILATSDEELLRKMIDYKEELKNEVLLKVEKMKN